MSSLTLERIQQLLVPYGGDSLPGGSIEKIARYLETFQHWSSRVNLTAVREPEQVVQRHFGEGFVLARALPACRSILDLGSGAGFPGLPIALVLQSAQVTLAESQRKKSAFLKEAAWTMELSVTVWPERAERLPKAELFDAVTLRAVDNMPAALDVARGLLRPGGTLAFFAGEHDGIRLPGAHWGRVDSVDVPGSAGHIVLARLA